MEYKEIKKLMDDMGESKLDSLEIEFPEGIKISMKKRGWVCNIITDNKRQTENTSEICKCGKTPTLEHKEPKWKTQG